MKFVLDAEQQLFGETLRRLLTDADVPKTIRAWSVGAHEPGRALWAALADAGVFAVAVPESAGGVGPLPVEMVIAALELGRFGVPGPWVETLAAAQALDSSHLSGVAEGTTMVTFAAPPETPYALDADAASLTLLTNGDELHLAHPIADAPLKSLDPARRLFPLTSHSLLNTSAAAAFDTAVLISSAQLLGIGRALLDVSVDYARARHQFGRPIGEFQAVKHHLADAFVALEFAAPLVRAAALSHNTPDFPRDVSAAKAAASEAAYRTAKTALQVHGAIGYTDEYDPSLLIRKARALHTAWGTPTHHRARLLTTLTSVGEG